MVALNSLKPKGTMGEIASSNRTPIPCYQVGATNPKRIVLVFTDVFGINSGNQKVFCDCLAETLGDTTAVWIPDIFRGTALLGSWGLPEAITMFFAIPSIIWAMKTRMTEKNVEADLQDIAKATGAAKVACVGFCYGGWMVARCAANKMCQASVGIHPSWKPETAFGKAELDLAARVGTTPYLFLPAGNDDLKPGHKVVEALAKERNVSSDKISIEFPNQVHGWVARGDPSDATIREAQDKAIKLTVDFIQEHVAV
jgi:dienelactone hydrolase